jgi:hypothetical protein
MSSKQVNQPDISSLLWLVSSQFRLIVYRILGISEFLARKASHVWLFDQ